MSRRDELRTHDTNNSVSFPISALSSHAAASLVA